jgi:predicted nucleic acid-binding protein
MMVPESLRKAQRAVLDTMVFVYLFEDAPRYGALCDALIRLMAERSYGIVVTPITVAELLVKPVAAGRPDIADQYRSAIDGLTQKTLATIDFDTGCMAGALRAKYGLKLPDMFQLACAAQTRSVLVTNDATFRRVTEAPVCMLDDFG